MLVNGTFDEFTGAPVVDSSLTQWLDFGQTSSYSGSGTTVTDLSPTATASVTLTGSPTFNNIDGGGSEAFNGSTQYGTGLGTPLGLSAYTKSFWFKLTSYLPGNNVVSSDVGGHFCYFGGGNKLQSGHSFWSNYGAFTSVTTFALNTWYHACLTFNTSTGMALYINGVLDSTYVSNTTNPTNTPVTGTGRVDIANYGTGNNLAGSIGQVMVYNRTLTAGEVLKNYNALAGRYGLPINTSGTAIQKTTANTVVAEQFDEVTFNRTTPVITNLITYSQDFTQGSQWSAISGLVVTSPNAIAPDGTLTAQLLTGNGVTTGYLNTTFPWIVGNNYTFSCYFKSGTLSTVTIYLYGSYFGTTGTGGTGSDFNLTTEIATSFGGATTSIKNVGNGWYRCSVTAPAYITRPLGDIGCQAIRMSSTSGTLYAWGYQIEQSSNLSIYQPIAAANTLVTPVPAQKKDNLGSMYVSTIFDEYTGAPVIDSSTKFWIDFGQSTSYPGTGTTVNDLSGSGLNMSLIGSGFYALQQQGMQFTRTSSTPKFGGGATVTTSGSMAATSFLYNDHTWEVWFKIDDITSGNYDVTEGFSTLCLYSGYHAGFYYTSTTMSYTIWNTGPVGSNVASWTVGLTGAQINQGNWYQIVVTRAGNVFTPYINGVQLGTGSTTATTYPAGTTGNGLYIGKSQNVDAGQSLYLAYSKNTIDCVRMYTRALSADEVAQNFNALRRRYNI
jgi:hypothetical protein